jgi:hypothetical protein
MTLDIVSSTPTELAATALKTTTLVLGGLITYHAYRAYRRTGSPALWALAAGFGVVTLGSAAAGVVDQFRPLEGAAALAVESAFTAVGFGTILWSLYRTEESEPPPNAETGVDVEP